MSSRKRSVESDTGLSIGPKIQPYYPFPFILPTGTSTEGRSEARSEGSDTRDGWKVPMGPVETDDEVVVEPPDQPDLR